MRHSANINNLEPGTIISGNYKYQIISEIGRGAMAVVYLARQVDLERQVAVKILSDKLASNNSFVLRFFNEVRTAASLSHPNIIQAYDAGIAEGDIYYFAMEYVNGETLLKRILREDYLELGPTLKYASEIASALNYGWQKQRLTHGDIKPENIMINEMNQAKLADFGLAKVAGHEYEGQELLLTPHYASPELIRGRHPKGDCRADIYAFGASLYHLLSGKPPFPGNDGQVVMKRHLEEELEPLSRRRPGVRSDISKFIGQMLDKKPENRPADWNIILKKIEQFKESIPAEALTADSSKIRIQRPVGAVKIPVASKATISSLKPKDKRKGTHDSFWWSFAIVIASLLLAFLIFMHWRKQQNAKLKFSDDIELLHNDAENNNSANLSEKNIINKLQVEKTEIEQAGNNFDFGEEKQVTAALEKKKEENFQENDAEEFQPEEENLLVEEKTSKFINEIIYSEYFLSSLLSVEEQNALKDIEAWYLLHNFQHIPGQSGSAERLLKLVKKLQQETAEHSELHSCLLFLSNSVVHLLDEGSASLILNKETLINKEFESNKGQKLKIIDVFPSGIKSSVILEKGTMQRDLTWREAVEEGLLLAMYKAAFFHIATDAKPELYLAQLLFSQSNSKLFQDAIKEYAFFGKTDLSQWIKLASMIALNETNSEILAEFNKLSKLCFSGARFDALSQAKRMQRFSSKMSDNNKFLLNSILDSVADLQLDVHAGKLLRDAQNELHKANPLQTLKLISAAKHFYGRLRFPEKVQISYLQEKAIEELAIKLDFSMQGLQYFPLFSNLARDTFPYTGLVELKKAERAEIKPLKLEAIYRLAADIEAGNWAEALENEDKAFEQFEENQAELADFETQFLYYKALLDWRKNTEKESQLNNIRKIFQTGNDQKDKLLLNSKALELHLLRREKLPDEDLSFILKNRQQLFSLEELIENPPFLWQLISLLLEQKQDNEFLNIVEGLKESFADSAHYSWLLSQLEVLEAFYAGAKKQLTSNEAVLTVFSGDLLENQQSLTPISFFRAKLAALSGLALSDKEDSLMLNLFEREAKYWQIEEGEAVFDWLLRRVSWQLYIADLPKAVELCDKIAAIQSPCIFPFYTKIIMLKNALLAIKGAEAPLVDLQYLIRSSNTSSEYERRSIRNIANKTQVNLTDKRTDNDFYLTFLLSCINIDNLTKNEAFWVTACRPEDFFSAELSLYRAFTEGKLSKVINITEGEQ